MLTVDIPRNISVLLSVLGLAIDDPVKSAHLLRTFLGSSIHASGSSGSRPAADAGPWSGDRGRGGWRAGDLGRDRPTRPRGAVGRRCAGLPAGRSRRRLVVG